MQLRHFVWNCLKERTFPVRFPVTVLPPVFLLAALLLLIIPVGWFLAAVSGAFIHEICHILMIRSLGLRIDSVSVGIGGAQIKTESMSDFQELLCALAGPVGGLCLLLTAGWFPRVAICAAFQSAYNLLPIYPNDGGRVLRCLTRLLMPERAAHCLCCSVEVIVLLLLAAIGIYGTFVLHLGVLPVAISWVLIMKAVKIPCKPHKHKVQ